MDKHNSLLSEGKILYFHCFSGISGDMILGALLDTGLVSMEALKAELKKVPLNGYALGVEKVRRGGLSGTRVAVREEGPPPPLRRLRDLLEVVNHSGLGKQVKEKAREVFRRLARAEASVHGTTLEQVHFHEVGAVDTLVDVLGTLLLLEKIGAESIYSSPVALGSGFVRCAHGVLPLPAPATVELLKGAPVYSRGIEGELTTPTGAALLTALSEGFGPLPAGKLLAVGYGAGSRELEHPNLLRVLLLEKNEDIPPLFSPDLFMEGCSFTGQEEEKFRGSLKKEKILSVETNIDDMNPEVFPYLMEKLFEAGAWDVTLTPVYMKKSRPALRLGVLCSPKLLSSVSQIIFKETSGLGLRVFRGEKYSLPRELHQVDTPFGPVGVKVGFWGEEPVILSPEYEDCARTAREKKVPLKEVYRAAQKSGEEMLKNIKNN